MSYYIEVCFSDIPLAGASSREHCPLSSANFPDQAVVTNLKPQGPAGADGPRPPDRLGVPKRNSQKPHIASAWEREGRGFVYSKAGIRRVGQLHSVCRLAGSGQVQCTSRRNFAPFTSSVTEHYNSERAIEAVSAWASGWVRERSARTQITNCIKQNI